MDKLNLMRSFVAVVEEGTYTAAAKRLGKTKALLSNQVSQLEEQLEVRLIQRSTRSLHVTDTGQAYYLEAKRILDEVSALEASLKTENQSMVGRLRMTAPITFGEQVLMPFIAQIKQDNPDLLIEIMLADRYVDLVDEGFDLALRIGLLEDSNLIAKPLGQSKLVACAAPNFIQKMGSIHSPDRLTSLPCIVDSNYKGQNLWRFNSSGENFSIKVNECMRVNGAQAANQLASLGVGVCITPDFAAKAFFETGQLMMILENYEIGVVPIQVVYPSRQHLSPKVSFFIDELSRYINNKENESRTTQI